MRTILSALLLFLPSLLSAQPTELRTLLPRPKSAFVRPGSFTVGPNTPMIAPAGAATAWLQARVKQELGDTLEIISRASYTGGPVVILEIIGPTPSAELAAALPAGETLPPAQGYVIDITAGRILVAGRDAEGLFNGVVTLLQLDIGGAGALGFRGVHINDRPDYPDRLVFSQHNLRGAGAIGALRRIADTMAAYKLNGLQQNDFKFAILREQPRHYFDSVSALLAIAATRSIAIVPGVAPIGYSEGLLWHDANLSEGVESFASYVIESDTGRIIPDPRVTLPNGNFESTSGTRFTGWSFYDEATASIDRTIFHSGGTSARNTGFTGANSRFSRRLDCQPYRLYRMSAWLRTENFDGDEVRLLAIGQDDNGGSRSLTATAFVVPATSSGWMRVEVLFNTLSYNHIQVYAGVWGARAGTIWWDDFSIVDAGAINILRRAGTPLWVRNGRTGAAYAEGADFMPLVDSIMLRSAGVYPIDHAPPTLRRNPAGAIRNGDTVRLSWFHALTTLGDARGIGQNMVCPSEPKLYDILEEQIHMVDSLFQPEAFMLGHDEIRLMNHDSACLARGVGPAALLADNVTRTVEIVEEKSPGARKLVWSDMYDSLHNAVDDYYLVNGDLRGVWNGIPKELVIVNWNAGNKKESMEFFARHGFEQITSPYYDAGSSNGIRQWRHAMEGIPGMRGMMYTTWSLDYRFLRPFAHYAWGAGPYIIHTPLDTSIIHAGLRGDSTRIVSTVLPDPFDPSERITSVKMTMTYIVGGDLAREEFDLTADTGNTWIAYSSKRFPDPSLFEYHLTATSSAGLQSRTPEYAIPLAQSNVALEEGAGRMPTLLVAPNPFGRSTRISFSLDRRCGWKLGLHDLVGNQLRTIEGEGLGAQTITLDAAGLPSGYYRLELRTCSGTTSEPVWIGEERP